MFKTENGALYMKKKYFLNINFGKIIVEYLNVLFWNTLLIHITKPNVKVLST